MINFLESAQKVGIETIFFLVDKKNSEYIVYTTCVNSAISIYEDDFKFGNAEGKRVLIMRNGDKYERDFVN